MEKQSAAAVLAAKVTAGRLKKKLGKRDLANKSSISRVTLDEIEKAQSDPKLSTIVALAEALDTVPSKLIP